MTKEKHLGECALTKQIKCLIVDDSENAALLELQELQKGGYEPTYQRVETREEMNSALEQKTFDVVISDFNLPKFTGLEALKVLEEKGFDLPFIIVADTISEEIALEVMKADVHAFFKKKNIKLLVPAVERGLREVTIKRERKQAESNKYSEVWLRIRHQLAFMIIVQKGKFVDANPKFQHCSGLS